MSLQLLKKWHDMPEAEKARINITSKVVDAFEEGRMEDIVVLRREYIELEKEQ